MTISTIRVGHGLTIAYAHLYTSVGTYKSHACTFCLKIPTTYKEKQYQYTSSLKIQVCFRVLGPVSYSQGNDH